MLAVMLVLGFVLVSCDDGSGKTNPPVVDRGLAGIYELPDGTTMTINPNGTGSVDGAAASFAGTAGVLTVTIGNDVITVDFNIGTTGVTFTNVQVVQGSGGALEEAFDKFVAASPIKPGSLTPGGEESLPAELVGSWKATSLAGAGKVVFVINSTNPQVFASIDHGATGGLVDCTWSSPASGKLKLTWTIEECTFDYSISSGQLVLSNPTPSNSVLAPYVNWGPFEKDEEGQPQISIDDFTWINTIPEALTGTWVTESDYILNELSFGGVPILEINSDGTGGAYDSSIFGLAESTFAVTADSEKLKMTVGEYGSVMYGYEIVEGQLILTLLVNEGTTGLAFYAVFGPLDKDLGGGDTSPIDDYTWLLTIPAEFRGTWTSSLLALVSPTDKDIVFVIAEDGNNGQVHSTTTDDLMACIFSFTAEDGDKLLLDLSPYGRVMFDCEINEGDLVISNPVSDGFLGEALESYVLYSPMTAQ